MSAEGSYSKTYLDFLERMHKLTLHRVFSGHDPPLEANIKPIIEYSIRMAKQSLATRGTNTAAK
jgi:hypothetical protein